MRAPEMIIGILHRASPEKQSTGMDLLQIAGEKIRQSPCLGGRGKSWQASNARGVFF